MQAAKWMCHMSLFACRDNGFMFNSIKLQHKLIFLVSIPLILFLSSSVFQLFGEKSKADNANSTLVTMELAVANSNLVHELQKERGLTAGYLSSGRSADFERKLTAQQKNTDRLAATRLAISNNMKADTEKAGLHILNSEGEQLVSEINAIRSRVKRGTVDLPTALAYYTNTNKKLLELISFVSQKSSSAVIKQQGLAYYNFVQAKERAGIERAVMTTVFSRDEMDINVFQKLNGLVTRQDTYLNEFSLITLPKFAKQLVGYRASSEYRDFANYRELAFRNNLAGNYGVNAQNWFDSATARINKFKQMEQSIADNLISSTRDGLSAAYSSLFFHLSLVLVCVVISSYAIWRVIKGINTKVGQVVDVLSYSADNNSLERRIEARGRDELSTISQNVNQLLATFGSAITTLRQGSESLASSSEQNKVSIIQTNEALERQKQQTFQVATAMEEMVATIDEVSRNTQLTADAVIEAKQFSDEGQLVVEQAVKQINEVSDSVSGVYQLISNLNQQSKDIVSVIDVIKSVAEQTNLLALNAAIEAARAGEQGRGFAVVADEVRTLAQRTQESTVQIEQIIGNFTSSTELAFNDIEKSQLSVKESTEQADGINRVFEKVKASIETIQAMAEQTSVSTEQQAKVAQEINTNVSEISSSAEQSSIASREITVTSEEQTALARELLTLSAKFSV